jgi:hypothetical protein
MIRIARLGLVVFALTCFAAATAASAATQIPRSVPIAASAGASGAVQQECQLQTRLPDAIAKAATDVELVDAPNKSGRWLELEISEVHGPGGGPFSGPKWMAVTGKLHERGKVIGSFRAKRLSTGGFVKGTCATLGGCATAIGRDVAAWLQAPTMNAELGDAR